MSIETEGVVKIVHVAISESEEMVLWEPLNAHVLKISNEPDSLEKHFKLVAFRSLLRKLGSQMFPPSA